MQCHQPLSKLLYNKYTFKIKLEFPDNLTLEKFKHSLTNEDYKLVKRKKYSFIKKVKKTYVTTVYLNNKKIFDSILDNYSKNIKQTHYVINDHHLKLLQENADVLIRKTLFFNEFRYKLKFSSNSSTVSDFVDSLDNRYLVLTPRSNCFIIYTIDKDDFLKCFLSFNCSEKYIVKTEEELREDGCKQINATNY